MTTRPETRACQKRREHWKNVLKDFKESGVNQTTYCKTHKISPTSLTKWETILEEGLEDAKTGDVTFGRDDFISLNLGDFKGEPLEEKVIVRIRGGHEICLSSRAFETHASSILKGLLCS